MATTARALGPDEAPGLLALYRAYDWWADREVEGVRRAPAATDEAVGIRDDAGDLVASARHSPASTSRCSPARDWWGSTEPAGSRPRGAIEHPDGELEELQLMVNMGYYS